MLAMRGGAAPALVLTDDERAGLESVAGSPSQPYRAVRQAQGLLLAAAGVSNEETGQRTGVSSKHGPGVAGIVRAAGGGRGRGGGQISTNRWTARRQLTQPGGDVRILTSDDRRSPEYGSSLC
jgi:hypothetical protein